MGRIKINILSEQKNTNVKISISITEFVFFTFLRTICKLQNIDKQLI